jgi:exopolysaccharide biosynthesis protein
MKLLQKTVQTTNGPVVIHWITLDPRKIFADGGSLFPVVADMPNTIKKMEQIASSFRRIKNVGVNGIRGLETNDTVFIISRNQGISNQWEPLEDKGRMLLSADAIEFTILTQLIEENRLWMHKGYRRWFEVSSERNKVEKQIVTQLSQQRRMYYSIPKSIGDSSRLIGTHNIRDSVDSTSSFVNTELIQDGWIPVQPTLLPIGYANSFATLPEFCEQEQANAGINGGYFLNMPEELDSMHGVMNDPVGLLMLNGKIIVPPTFHRSTFLINNQGKVFIRRISMADIDIQIADFKLQSPKIYTRADGTKTPEDFARAELVITNQEVVEVNATPPTLIPQNGFVVSLPKKSTLCTQLIKVLKSNRAVEYTLRIPRTFGTIIHALAAGPQLVENGRTISAYFFERKPLQEDFHAMVLAPTRFTHTVTDEQSRAPRSALGITKDNQVLLVTVDGVRKVKSLPNERSRIGVTLGELAQIMVDLGCIEAINFDGGGSTTLWYDGKIVNEPADGFPRVISTAILVK